MLPPTAARGLRRVELLSNDPVASAAFHEALLGWRSVQTSETGFDCWVGERRCATIRAPHRGESTGWRIVFAGGTDDSSLNGPDETTAAHAGGRAQHGPWAPAPRLGEPCWVDLFAQDPGRADAYWAEAFQWSRSGEIAEDTATYACEGRPVAARTGAPRPDGDWGWLCYYAVRHLDAAEDRVPELGGRILDWVRHPVVREAAVVADPRGAVFALTPHTQHWGVPAGQLVS